MRPPSTGTANIRMVRVLFPGGIPFVTMLNSIHPGTNYYDGTFGITVCFSTLREFRAMVTSAYLAMWYPSKWR